MGSTPGLFVVTLQLWVVHTHVYVTTQCIIWSRWLCPGLGCCRSTTSVGCRHHETVGVLVWQTTTVIGARDFAVSAVAIWNSLPAVLRLSSCLVQTFVQKLQTFYPVRWCSSSDNYLFCALRIHSLLLLLVLPNKRWCSVAGKVTTSLAESNGSLHPSLLQTDYLQTALSFSSNAHIEYPQLFNHILLNNYYGKITTNWQTKRQ